MQEGRKVYSRTIYMQESGKVYMQDSRKSVGMFT